MVFPITISQYQNVYLLSIPLKKKLDQYKLDHFNTLKNQEVSN